VPPRFWAAFFIHRFTATKSRPVLDKAEGVGPEGWGPAVRISDMDVRARRYAKTVMIRTLVTLFLLATLSACAGGPPEAPYPAFIQVDELEDIFMATLPGIRAKQLAGDPQTRRTSNRINLPPDWKGTSGGMPGRSMEIFVLAGALKLADIELVPWVSI
jgi:hypothetical protein